MYIRIMAIMLAILAGAAVVDGQERLTPALRDQVLKGKGKLTDEELVKLVPGPYTVQRNDGPVEGDWVLTWEEVNRIRVEFSEGKVTLASGVFSDVVVSKTLTLGSLKKIAKGMTREAAQEILGKPGGFKGQFSEESLPDAEGLRQRQVCEWTQGRSLRAYLKDGKLVGVMFADTVGR